MQAQGSATDQLFEKLRLLKQEWPKAGWSWDYRFSAVASSFHVDLTDEAHGAVIKYLPNLYTYKTIDSAPAAIKEVAESSGGVRTDQRLYATSQTGRMMAFGMWWPWGDEITISLRIGLAGYVSDADTTRLQELFNAIS